MNVQHYIGFDVHKKTVSYCVKASDGTILEEGKMPAKRATPGQLRKRKFTYAKTWINERNESLAELSRLLGIRCGRPAPPSRMRLVMESRKSQRS